MKRRGQPPTTNSHSHPGSWRLGVICQSPAPGTSHAQTLDDVFGSGDWRTEIVGAGVDDRLNEAIPLLARATGAKWWTSAVRMVTAGHATRYLLLHLRNSDDGRDLMKECSWKIFPDGEFVARRSDNPDQPFLFEREPDRIPLRNWILGRLTQHPHRWRELHDAVRGEWWLEKHVNTAVKDLKQEGRIAADPVAGKTPGRAFTVTANPVLCALEPRCVVERDTTQPVRTQFRKDGGRVAGLARADRAPRSCWTAMVSRFSIACETRRCWATPSVTLAANNLRRAEWMAGSPLSARAPADRTSNASTVSASDKRARSRWSAAVVMVRPRFATSIDARIFSSAFSTLRNAAIACTSGSAGFSLMSTGTAPGMRLDLNACVP